jgi:hypothetical protein
VADPQIVQRGIGLRERIARYLHFDAGARRDAQELVPVFAREIVAARKSVCFIVGRRTFHEIPSAARSGRGPLLNSLGPGSREV